MKKTLIFAAFIIMAVGCTGPKYRYAEYSLRTGINNDDKVVNDCTNLIKQNSLNNAGQEVTNAVKAQDADGAKKSVKKLVNVWDQAFALQLAHERNRELQMIGLQYVWEQQGVLNLLAKDWRDAEVQVEQNATTQPTSQPSAIGIVLP